MMPSPSIHQPAHARHSGWLSASTAPAYCRSINRPAVTTNPVRQRPLHSFSPSPMPTLRGKAIEAGALIQPSPT